LNIRKLFPHLLVGCFALCLTTGAAAQRRDDSSRDSRRTSASLDADGSSRLGTEVSVPPAIEESRPRVIGARVSAPAPTSASLGRFDQRLLTSIESHLGSPYHYTGTGPDSFDCSGFVWRTFQEAGFDFSRGPARSYYATFAPATKEEESKFGTLVFFSGLAHVGIVVDEKGFYHASRHHGVIYSPFNDYWLSRIDGFRRVPLDSLPKSGTMNQKARNNKPVINTQNAEEDNEP
jgi:peptidoglycan endopeptidase LytE